MENESFGEKLKRRAKRFFRIAFSVIIISLIVFFCFSYFAVYERGVMAGKVLRVSERGVIFKTYEGKLNLETFGALKGTSPIAESFDFSVEKSQDDVIKELQDVALSGERVNLYFVKRYMSFPWRGETKYFVEKVERIR
jgi:hypothetical protein